MRTKSLDWNAVPESFEREIRVPVFVDNLMDLTRATVLNVDNTERMRGSLAATTFYVASRLGPGSLFSVLDTATGTVLLSSDGKNITALNQNLLRSFFEAAEVYFHARNELIVKIESTVKSSLQGSTGNTNHVSTEKKAQSQTETANPTSQPQVVSAPESVAELSMRSSNSDDLELAAKSKPEPQPEVEPVRIDSVDTIDLVDSVDTVDAAKIAETSKANKSTDTSEMNTTVQGAIDRSPASGQPGQPTLKRRISITAPSEPVSSPTQSVDSVAENTAGASKQTESAPKPEQSLSSEPVKGEGYVELNPSMFKRRTVNLR